KLRNLVSRRCRQTSGSVDAESMANRGDDMIRNMSTVGGMLVLLGASQVALGAPVPTQDAKAAVATFFINLEKGAGDSAPLFAAPAKDVITELAKYLGSGTDEQQSHAVRMIGVIGRLSKDKDARTLAVKSLLNYATTDGKSEARQALERLLEFTK